MKKFKKVFLSATSLLSMITLVGCKENDNNSSKKEEITVVSVKQTGLNASYHVLEGVDFSNVKLKVNYSDNKSKELTKGEVDIASENAKADTEFVLYTSELSKQSAGSLQVGDYKIECSLKEETFKTRYTVCTVSVVDTYNDLYDLNQFNEPKSIAQYKNSIKNSENNSETSFKVKDETYVIGDDNEFIYKPETLLLKKNSQTPTTITASIPLQVKVTDLNDKMVEPGQTTYTFNEATSGIKFSDTQIGNNFKLEYTPKGFTEVNGDPIEPLELNVKVEDGYNAYSALDLGRLNLLTDQHIQDVIKDQPTDHVLDGYQIYNKNYELTHVYDKQAQNKLKTVHTYQIWKDFLTSKAQNDLNEINGIYLHNDIEITQDDIPIEYFISEEEAKDMANDTFSAGTLRDFSFIYSHFLIDSNFNFNGNYFNLDFSKVKPGRTNSGFDGADFWYKQNQGDVQMGHSAAFVFTNKIDKSNYQYTTTMKNVQSIGNIGQALEVKPSADKTKTEKDPNQAIIDDAAGGLIFLKSCYGLTNIDNFIIKNYMIGLFPSGEVSNKCMEIKNGRVYNCFNSGIFSYCSTENELKNCEFKRFGGPAIFLNSRKWKSNEKDYYGASSINIDKDCVFENYVDGTEPWFAINKATQTATQITGLFEKLMNSYLSSIVYKDEKDANASAKMNLIMVGLDNGFLSATEKTRVKCDIEGYNSFSTYDDAISDTFNSTASDIRTTFPYSIAGGMPIVRAMNKGDDKSKDILGAVYPGNDQDTTHPAGLYKADGLSDYHLPFTDGTQQFPGGNTLSGDYLQIFYPIAGSQTEVAMLLTMHQLNLG